MHFYQPSNRADKTLPMRILYRNLTLFHVDAAYDSLMVAWENTILTIEESTVTHSMKEARKMEKIFDDPSQLGESGRRHPMRGLTNVSRPSSETHTSHI